MTVFAVVSDRFNDFANHCGALAFSDAREKLRSGQFAPEDRLIIGQGLSDIEKISLEAHAHLAGTTALLALWRGCDMPAAASPAIIHKRRAENTLISTPVLVAADHYRSSLLLSAQNELLLDHNTGQHVQGMVLIEACRQMAIAVSELNHMGQGENRQSYTVFNGISVTFPTFTFPLPADVEYRLSSCNDTRPGRAVISAEISVWQNGVKTTHMEAAYALFEPARLRPREVAKGVAAVDTFAMAIKESLQAPALG